MSWYSLCMYSMIIQLQVGLAVHCILSTPNNVPCIVMKNNTDEMYFTPCDGDMS
jgi:hypothetical protein